MNVVMERQNWLALQCNGLFDSVSTLLQETMLLEQAPNRPHVEGLRGAVMRVQQRT